MGRHKTAPADNMESPRLLNEPSTLAQDNGNNEYGKKYEFSPDFEGPVKNRSCTDVLCFLLFLVFLGGWGVVAYIGISQGDIDKVRKSGSYQLRSGVPLDLLSIKKTKLSISKIKQIDS
jgi:hypothetical protein